jgi:hypothetical protein
MGLEEAIARFPLHDLTVKAEKERLRAGRLVKYDGKSDQNDRKAIHAPENSTARQVLGCTQRDSVDPKGVPAPDPNDRELRVDIVRQGSIARVLAEGEVEDGEEVMVGKDGKVKALGEGKNAVGLCMQTGKDVLIEVELY